MTATLDRTTFLQALNKDPHRTKKHYLRQLAARGREDYWFFLRKVLRNPVLEESLHKPIADWLQHDRTRQKKMLLMSRGHVKSNIFTVGYALWRAVCDPNIRILLDSHKDKDAAKFLRLIRAYVEDEWFQKVYPDIHPAMDRSRKKQWNESHALLERESDLVEATWEVSSITAEVTGRHYNLIISDDMVTRTNVNTATLLEQTAEHHKLLESLLDPGGEECVIGTRYHFSDEYGRIMDDPDLAGEYDVRIVPAVKDSALFDRLLNDEATWSRDMDHAALVYPKRFTLAPRDYVDPDNPLNNRKSLIALRRIQGAAVYANQYALEPFNPADAVFKERDLVEVNTLPDTPLEYYRFMDLSSDKATKDSFTAIWTVAVDERCNVYLVDLFHGTYDGTAIIDELISGQQVEPEVRPTFIGAEKGPYERGLKHFLDRVARERKCWLPMEFLKGPQSNKPKGERIMGLQPWVEAGKIRFLRSCRNKHIAMEEFLGFPKHIRKDCLDALAQFPPLVFPGGDDAFLREPVPAGDVKPGGNLESILKRLERRTAARTAIGSDRVMAQSVVRLARGYS